MTSNQNNHQQCIAEPSAERVAKIVFEAFERIPKSGKPIRGKEWTVLSAILIFNRTTTDLKVVALGTGD